MAATFGGLVLTNVGRNLLAKAQMGKELKILRIELGDGQLGSSESMLNLTKLKHKLFNCEIISKQIIQSEILKISFMLVNQEEGFYWREVGVIAEDPDTKEEILYCYGNARENGEYIAPAGGADVLERKVNLDLLVSDASNITVIVSESMIYVSKEEYDLKMQEIDIEIAKKADKKKTWNVSIPTTGWSSTAPYSKTIAVEGIKARDEPNMYLVKSTNSETRKAQQEAFNKISDSRTANDSITIYCDEEVIETAITVKLEVLY